MVISNSGAATARPTFRKGSAESPAMEALVPGDYSQTEESLAAYPQPVLDMLASYGTRVAILGTGQSLADSPALRTLTDQEAAAEAKTTSAIVNQGVTEAFAKGISSYNELETAADGITRKLRDAGIENHLGIALSPFPLGALAEAREIPADKVQDWKTAFAELNSGLAEFTADGVQAKQGVVILPHTYHNGKTVPEGRLNNSRQITESFVSKNLGLNRAEDRLILLAEQYTALPSPELGNYGLAIHEMGHALDHALEHLANFPGFGAFHRQTIDAMFEADQAKVTAGAAAETIFTSDRADDDVREYFAEAVEAYLTPENSNGHDTFRAENSREGLAAKNPELYGYIEKVMTTDFPSTALPEVPKRTFAPPGFPDPDLQVISIS